MKHVDRLSKYSPYKGITDPGSIKKNIYFPGQIGQDMSSGRGANQYQEPRSRLTKQEMIY